MSKADAPTAIGPDAYASWRATPLGIVTEAIEQRLILDMMGEVAGRRVLDAGCGDGALVLAAAVRGADVTGIDPDPAMLAAARSRVTKAGVRATFLEGRVERLPFPDGSFDVVASITVLCFVPDAVGAVREMARVLRPGGRLVLGELGRWSLWAALRRLRGWFGSSTWKAAQFRTATELRCTRRTGGAFRHGNPRSRLLPAGRPSCTNLCAFRSLARPFDDLRRRVHRARCGFPR